MLGTLGISSALKRWRPIKDKKAKHYLNVPMLSVWHIISQWSSQRSPSFGWTLTDLSQFSSLSHVKQKQGMRCHCPMACSQKLSQWLNSPKSSLFSPSWSWLLQNVMTIFLMSKMIWKKYFSVFILMKESTLLYKVLFTRPFTQIHKTSKN